MNIPINKYSFFSLAWFIASIYSLIFQESNQLGTAPFPHFDKLAHCLLFFAQIWLITKAYRQERYAIPYIGIFIFALIYAMGSEIAQGLFTQTRQASWLDGLADLVGAILALWLAFRVHQAKQIKNDY